MSFLARSSLLAGASLVLAASGAACGPELNPFELSSTELGESGGSGSPSGDSAGGVPTNGGSALVPIGGGGRSASSGGVAASGSAGMQATAGVAAGEGGAAPDGAGGAAGDQGVVVEPDSACYGQTHVPEALLSDFEQGQEHWFAYVDAHEVAVGEQHPGAMGSERAARFAGGKADAAGIGIGMFCDDVTSFDGVSFWAKGHGGEHLRFLVAIPATDATPGRGDCDPQYDKCNDHPGLGLTLTNEWQRYSVSWSELEQYGWGTAAKFAGVANSLLWINDGPVESFEFAIDEVRLY